MKELKKTGKRDSLRTGDKQAVRKLRSGLDPAIGRATQFQPGHSFSSGHMLDPAGSRQGRYK